MRTLICLYTYLMKQIGLVTKRLSIMFEEMQTYTFKVFDIVNGLC